MTRFRSLPYMPLAAWLGLLLLAAVGPCAVRADNGSSDTVHFNRDVRPILSQHCFACHGQDATKRRAGLRLDFQDSAIAALKDGRHAVVPGKPDQSELVSRITSADADERMPPADFHKDLSADQIAVLTRWIEQGAPYEAHWAYAPLKRPASPDVKDQAWPINEVDRFVLAKLESKNIAPSSQADRITLIRRLSLDLIGLPPTPAQVDSFVNDTSPNAYEKVVDRLLASPHFGERLAAYWLDLVRYADTVGYHGDQDVTVWPYRDYVINAFNSNMPFDQFTRENLAGDLLPDATREQQIAAVYNRLGMMTREGGSQPKDFLARYAADRVRTTSVAWLGATMGCSECHDHKFDPFTAKDFYSFEAFFADIKEPGVFTGATWGEAMPLPTEQQQTDLVRIDRDIAEARAALTTPTSQLAAEQSTWEHRIGQPTPWQTLAADEITTDNKVVFKRLDDGSYLATGPNPGEETYTFNATTNLQSITAVRVELLPDDSLPAHGPGRASNGNLVLNRITLTANGEPIGFAGASATFSQSDYNVESALKDNGKQGWALLPNAGQRLAGVFETAKDIGDGGTVQLVIKLKQSYGYQHTIGRFRISITNASRPVRANEDIDPAIAVIIQTPTDQRTDEQRETIATYFRSIAPSLGPVRNTLRELEQQKRQIEGAIEQMPITVAGEPRVMRLLPRGNWMDESGPIVQPAIPATFGVVQHTGERATRLDLANWIVSPDNPLTARVFANRVWYQLFGRGLSERLDDFGSQGTMPSHPQLLDFLASEFLDSGWNIKHLFKVIAMSAAYQQVSHPRQELEQQDPYNRLLARQGRFRLDAELVRDYALSVSGLLIDDIGGRSADPYQPKGYYSQLNFPQREYVPDTDENQYRRGLYTHWQRTFLHPMLKAFDAPSREECTAQRPRSNTPLAALTMLNDPSFVEAARALAQRIMLETSPDADVKARITWAYRQALSREPTEDVGAILLAVHEKQLDEYQHDEQAANELLSVGLSKPPADLDPAQLAAWTSVTRVILNLHEIVTRY